jgi:hypothetical protein
MLQVQRYLEELDLIHTGIKPENTLYFIQLGQLLTPKFFYDTEIAQTRKAGVWSLFVTSAWSTNIFHRQGPEV